MSHPSELLIDYVDGTLGPDATVQVEAHLEGCSVCREEVRLARMGARAAGSLPAPAVPAGLSERAIAEANRVAGERHPEVAAISSSRRRPSAPRWAAIATAAAAVIAIALIGPKLGQAPSTVAQEGAAAGGRVAPTAYPRPSAVEIQHVNYTTDGLVKATQRLKDTALRAATNGTEGATTMTPSMSDGAAFGGQGTLTAADSYSVARIPRATDCLTRAFGDPQGALMRIILAKYEGQPAYIGAYLVSPGAGLPASELRLDVASVHGCDFLAQTSARI
jgi:hypothetical protein